jgi:subtilisin family serine protease
VCATTIPSVKRAFVLLATAGFLGLTACQGTKAPAPPPVSVCDAATQGQGTTPASTPPPTDEPLAPEAAGETAKQEVATADTRTADGRVPLVTVEETGGAPVITSTPVSTPEEGEAVAEAAAADGDLVAVEADSVVTADVDPNDPRFMSGEQYAFQAVPFVQTWNAFSPVFTGVGAGAGQRVAVIDTGVQQNHPDLGTAQVLDGAVFGQPGVATVDAGSHGTRLAGIIAAATNNGVGIAGAAPAADILPVKVLNGLGQGFSSDVANGINWAVDTGGATVVNLSLGGPDQSDALRLAIQHAVLDLGVPVIASAGNSGRCGQPSYPGAFPEVMAVGATDQGNGWASFSTTGPYVSISAPGDDILSTSTPGNNYVFGDGTSFSAPFVSAAAAIVRATRGFGASDVYAKLVATATDLGAPGWDPFFGWGLVNVLAAATT